MTQTIPIRDGGVLIYAPDFLPQSTEVMEQLLARCRWTQEVSRGVPFPRLTAWYADPGMSYSYSGVTHQAEEWLPELLVLKQGLEELAQAQFNSVLINYYRTGTDSMGMHTDAGPEVGLNPVIGSLSLGALRRFVLKHNETGEKIEFELGRGRALIMAGTTQHFWRHAVPKTKTAVGPRVNLTFRKMLPVAERVFVD